MLLSTKVAEKNYTKMPTKTREMFPTEFYVRPKKKERMVVVTVEQNPFFCVVLRCEIHLDTHVTSIKIIRF